MYNYITLVCESFWLSTNCWRQCISKLWIPMTCNQKFLYRSLYIELSQIAVPSFTCTLPSYGYKVSTYPEISDFKTQSEIANSVAGFWIQKGLMCQAIPSSRLCSHQILLPALSGNQVTKTLTKLFYKYLVQNWCRMDNGFLVWSICRLFASRLCSNIFVKQTQCLTK